MLTFEVGPTSVPPACACTCVNCHIIVISVVCSSLVRMLSGTDMRVSHVLQEKGIKYRKQLCNEQDLPKL
jgi:hypothetical protein